MKSLYVRLVRLVAAPLRAIGVLGCLRRRAPRSRTATWLLSLFAIHDVDGLQELDVPWWTFDSADRAADWLREHPGARVFEWGSGASTMWLASRAGSVHSVEHHAGWASMIAPRLPDNVELRVVEPVASDAPVVGSAKPGHGGLDFADYVAAIDDVPGEFDLVVIDGRAREACLARAVDRLAPGGVIVFDNVDRRRYVDAIDSTVAAVGDRVSVTMTRGLTPALPYPTRTALLHSSLVPTRDAGVT
ncbi:Methyltransferase domain-containing protein [Nocardioides exalbidus]|uniref:Methyltransferase domain-containing protein n=1 Tax=Nocardioides exalbidus TaxID=402596 RepID=A0A1H4JE06_9ACTN|nr:class I SAM-dependent methyltransferase [Nocardioides exalbidus]SEB28651.1 Methyltransferase domain-containing protein [Nocardioides exalbidus]SEB44337.1 Methyltransferase domain-containing protein [Nocardioides exalbidus]